mmetsp:Transcript_19871/g.43154  ORF Transcript_19871/g.43154 Transcript_19871/m.43154 type:complete len:130 (-) Transcript_19871:138-527(-)|eukprot:CAMPEP_0168170028 /NCGR_PEP_ID=MMETSP0139_2-20121125/3951_1 /TAXON_ID=44445 /ORGANISM="Pseudo-nitzschia australis, Strain 10249 10 AB" /LENGTH=129 /DNA_ID=CAMNT_0008087483 /DNA_START=140 /DNA_END=529 /DNA_ORIENTATION=-
MVAKAPELNSKVVFISPHEEHEVSPKQLKRLEEQKAREAIKMAKRKAKAEQKERRAIEKEFKEAERERRLEQERQDNSGLCAKEMEEQERLAEEEKLFADYMKEKEIIHVAHVKKSTLESNRLGGDHMC